MKPELVPAAMTREMRRLNDSMGRTRVFGRALHLGEPGGSLVSIPDHPWYDDGMRIDLVDRALSGLDSPECLVWVTRPGELAAEDGDWRWLAAARPVLADHGQPLDHFHVVTRHGWHELLSGRQVWWPKVRSYQE